jgi:hypothetical protein
MRIEIGSTQALNIIMLNLGAVALAASIMSTSTSARCTASLTQLKSTTVHAKITKPLYGMAFKEAGEPSQIASSMGDPICSAIAIAFTKATGKLVKIWTLEVLRTATL